jgi:hypothetical protein
MVYENTELKTRKEQDDKKLQNFESSPNIMYLMKSRGMGGIMHGNDKQRTSASGGKVVSCGFFYDAAGISDYMAPTDRMINCNGFGKFDRVPIELLSWELPAELRITMKKQPMFTPRFIRGTSLIKV